MVREGWTQVEVPNGWVQIIRGPRPKSVQWPRASEDGKPQQPRQLGGARLAAVHKGVRVGQRRYSNRPRHHFSSHA